MLTMSRLYKNKKIVALLFCLIAVYTGMLVTGSVSEREPAALTFKYLGDIFCLLIVLASWRHAYSKADITLLLTGFFFVLGADALFLFARQLDLGIICFGFAHLVFMRRYQKKPSPLWPILLLAVSAFYAIGMLIGLQLPYIYILSVVYAALLFMDAHSGFRSALPTPNKTLVKVGMTFFILNDANNALMYLGAPGSVLNEITSYFVWVFYLPALVLLALSAYGYQDKNAGEERLYRV